MCITFRLVHILINKMEGTEEFIHFPTELRCSFLPLIGGGSNKLFSEFMDIHSQNLFLCIQEEYHLIFKMY